MRKGDRDRVGRLAQFIKRKRKAIKLRSVQRSPTLLKFMFWDPSFLAFRLLCRIHMARCLLDGCGRIGLAHIKSLVGCS